MNHDLAVEVLVRIVRDPDSWNQGYWSRRDASCVTTYCLAGHALVASGWRLSYGGDGIARTALSPDGRQVLHIAAAAAGLLGLDRAGRHALFGARMDLDYVFKLVDSLAEVEPGVTREKVYAEVGLL